MLLSVICPSHGEEGTGTAYGDTAGEILSAGPGRGVRHLLQNNETEALACRSGVR